MQPNPKARLTLVGRERRIWQHLEEGRSLAILTSENGISEHTAGQGLARFEHVGQRIASDTPSRLPRSWL